MRASSRTAALLLPGLLFLGACTENPTLPELPSVPDLPISAPPTIGNSPDAFGFSVVAQALDFDETFALTFTGDTARIGLTVSAYQGGRARLEVFGPDDAPLYARTLSGDVVEGTDRLAGQPERAVMHFEGFTGVVALGISAPEE